MLKKTVTAMTMLLMAALLTVPATAANSTDLSSDRMFEVTKELYERMGEVQNRAAGDRISASVMTDGTVILQGYVSCDGAKDEAETTAGKIAGVKRVINNIKAVTPAG